MVGNAEGGKGNKRGYCSYSLFKYAGSRLSIVSLARRGKIFSYIFHSYNRIGPALSYLYARGAGHVKQKNHN